MKKTRFLNLLTLAVAGIMGLSLSACSDSEEVSSTTGMITIASAYQDIQIGCDDTWTEVEFTARSTWSATVTSGAEWLSLKDNSGTGGSGQSFGIVTTKNTAKASREALISLACGSDKVELKVTQAPNEVETMSESDVKDFDKYYKPQEFSSMDMFKSDSKWSWFRHKQSDHFFVFWEPGFGDDPNAETVDAALRVDIDDLLEKAEQFYKTNVEKLKMVTTGQGKSQLDKYKMEIYLLYQTEWLATGSGYDNVIGALWVNPSTCQPVGSTIGHEIGHSFQYQVYCDKLLNGEAEDITASGFSWKSGSKYAFRYGFGPNGTDGCAYWEQCAQWQSFQDYPEESITQEANVNVWKQNHHRHFNHEWQRYASYWWQYYLTQKHGIEAYGKIWQESQYPEDPLMTAARLYCDNDMEKFYDEYYDYAARCVTYDFDAVHQYVNDNALNYGVTMLKNSDGAFQPAYSECPGTTGFNVIPLDLPAAGATVSASLKAIAPGSALISTDAGQMVDGDGKAVGTTTTYNQQSNTSSCYRLGFVSVDGSNNAKYGAMATGKDATAEYTVPSDARKLYLVVVATPTTYSRQYWNDTESDDEQWPYEVSFGNTTLKGYIDVDPNKEPESITLKYTVDCANKTGYEIGKLELADNGDLKKICQAFSLSSSDLAAATTTGVAPAEGKVAFCLLQPDGTLAYEFTSNSGFYIQSTGAVGSWSNNDPVWTEYDASNFYLTYGQHAGAIPSAGTTITVKPCLVYTKGGKQYTATFELTMQF